MALTVNHKDEKSFLGEDDHLKLSQQIPFSEMIFRVLSEQKPTTEQLKLFELVLNLTIDHGPDAPSAKKTIEEAQKGEPISESVAEGIEQISDTHGGAIEPAINVFYEIMDSDLKSAEVVKKFLSADMKIPGYGHRLYQVDPRAQLILETAKKSDIGPKFIEAARQIEEELQLQTGKNLPLNIDAAIAAVLCGFGWEPRLGKAVFIIARTPGLCAHFLNTATP